MGAMLLIMIGKQSYRAHGRCGDAGGTVFNRSLQWRIVEDHSPALRKKWNSGICWNDQ